MRRKAWQIVLCFVFVVLFIMASLPLTAFAATVDAKLIDYSDVYEDLKTMGIDPTKYPKDVTAKHTRMLHFLEWGYDCKGNQRDYGLYLYVYNPSGKEINLSPRNNYVQIQTYNSFMESNGWRKMELEKCSVSMREGYEHVFYKFKVKNAGVLIDGLQKNQRIYEISSVELRYKDSSYDLDSKVAARYTYTGYAPTYGATGVNKNTLRHKVLDTFTLELELHPATWKTSTSDKGEGYQYEMFSTYFSVPNDIIRDYGDMSSPTKGLVQVDGTFEEYKVGGIMTSHEALYNYVLPYLHKKVPYNANKSDAVPFWFYSAFREGVDQGPDVSFNQIQELGYQLNSEKALHYITNVIKYTGELSGLTPEETRDWIYSQIKFERYSEFLPWVDDGCKLGFQYYSVANEDDNGNKIDLGKEMASFADSYKRGKLLAWLEGVGSLVDGSKTYSGINPIRVVSAKHVDNGKTDAAIGEDLFVEACYVDDLRSEVNSAILKNKTTYLLRYAVRDYYCEDINVGTKDLSAYGFNDGNYYFEKTIFHNFDVLALTWQNEYGEKTVLPVASLPIDIFGTITPPAGDDTFDPGSGDKIEKEPIGCQVVNYRPIVIIVGILIGCLAVNAVLSFFNLSIADIFKWLFKIITWPFRLLWNMLKKILKKPKKKRKDKTKDVPKEDDSPKKSSRPRKKSAENMTDEDLSKLLKEYEKKERKRK